MALTTKGRATRDRIVAGAAEFLRASPEGEITLDDVRAITGTSNGQLFHYFPGGKEELLLAVVRHEADRVFEDQEPYLSSLTTWSSWERWRDVVVARYLAQGQSCALGSLMRQVGSTPGAEEVVARLLTDWVARLATGIGAMQEQGSMRTDVDAARAADAIVTAVQGGVTLLRATGSVAHLHTVLDLLLDHLRPPAPVGA